MNIWRGRQMRPHAHTSTQRPRGGGGRRGGRQHDPGVCVYSKPSKSRTLHMTHVTTEARHVEFPCCTSAAADSWYLPGRPPRVISPPTDLKPEFIKRRRRRGRAEIKRKNKKKKWNEKRLDENMTIFRSSRRFDVSPLVGKGWSTHVQKTGNCSNSQN